jgi:hypothetical protein
MKTRLRTLKTKGFALVATLSLMILLTLIAVGLLTLSTVTVRAGGRDEAMATARANARLALMIALGELQKTMGPDQSVSAPASAVASSSPQPHLTGTWEGWHWTPAPSGSPTYSDKKGKFQRWLISTADPKTAEDFAYASSAAPTKPAGVELVSDRKDSQGVSTLVLAEKVTVGDSTKPGKYAWAVFDESTKAAIDLGEPKTAQTTGEEIAARNSPYRMRADILESSGSALKKLKTPEKLYTLESAVLPVEIGNADLIRKRFHDFTTGSIGLLTDPVNGGLKRDLTSLFEEATLPTDGFLTKDSPYSDAFPLANGAPTWAYLQNHYRKYKNVTFSGSTPSYKTDAQEDFNVDTSVTPVGVNPAPKTERLLPTIAKFQLVFSMVAHWPFNVDTRRATLSQKGDPKDWRVYGVPHLSYDPVITLYNPYDVTLDLTKIRIRLWDPPVAFRFYRSGPSTPAAYFRQGDAWSTLAQLQIGYAGNTVARKCFTLLLADGTDQSLSGSLQLKPGEVKIFSPRVETAWNWQRETQFGYDNNMQNKEGTFFDFAAAKNFGNVDRRGTAKDSGKYGVEAKPGWVTRAGLQVDHLADPRNAATVASYESGPNGFVTMRSCGPEASGRNPALSDRVRVEVRPQIAAGNAAANFQVDILAGKQEGTASNVNNLMQDTANTGVAVDTLRSYRFTFSDPQTELWNGTAISKDFRIYDILQPDTDMTAEKKKPFAMLELSARTTKDQYTDTKPWLYNNFVVEGGIQSSATAGLALQSYDLRLIEMSSFNDFPDGIQISPNTFRGYFGASDSTDEGSSFVSMLHVPTAPAASLGDLIPANLVASSQLPRVVHPFGNSRAHPLLQTQRVARALGGVIAMDHSYLLNDALWDTYFFSSLTDYNTSQLSPSRSREKVLSDLLAGEKPALNTRLTPVKSSGDSAKLASDISKLTPSQRATQIAKHVAINGPFNVNSTSIDAWRAVLSSLRDRAVNGLEVSGSSLQASTYNAKDKTPVVRSSRPMGDDSASNEMRWAAFRTLTDDNIEDLAKSIVQEIVNRGKADSAPSMTLGEFVNRRVSSSSLQNTAGLLQTAIDNTSINKDAYTDDSKPLSIASVAPKRKTGLATSSVMNGNSAEGAPTVITQGDLMQGLAAVATVRGDTFKIRAYGEALEPDGTTVLARSWCEAVVQRTPDFVDPADAPETTIANLTSSANNTFGRRFTIVSFKYLDEKEL